MAKAYVPAKFREEVKNRHAFIQLTVPNIKNMAEGLMRYLINHELDMDVRIYYKKTLNTWCAITTSLYEKEIPYHIVTHTHGKKTYTWYELEDIDPHEYFEYNGDYLSMSFEGRLYHAINGTSFLDQLSEVRTHFNNYFSHWGLYYEQGHAWNLSLYEI